MKVIVVTGPTASGKTTLAVRLARRFNGEIISADSRQVYKGLDIGSGKDLAEYGTGAERIPVHLLDILDPCESEPFSLADFMRESKRAIRDICSRSKTPVLCGGTALYLHALMKGYDLPGGPADRAFRKENGALSAEELADMRTEPPPPDSCERANPYRMMRKLEIQASSAAFASDGGPLEGTEYLVIGTKRPREEIRRRIELRLDDRFNAGMMKEIAGLHDVHGVSWERLESFGLEYRYISQHLEGKLTFAEMHELLLNKIRQFAKRQDTWFRKMEREGILIHWLDPENLEEAATLCGPFLAN